MRQYAGFIGRFQPWHKGHQRVLERMAADGRQPVLFVGSCNADRDPEANPFSFEERCAIIREACKHVKYPDGSPVEPVLVPVYDYPRPEEEKPYYMDGEKRVPLNSRWFAQFTQFFLDSGIAPEDFTLYYSVKDKDRKNYVFRPGDGTDTASSAFAGAAGETVARNEDLSYAFTLLGCKRERVEVTEENATDIRKFFTAGRNLLVPGCEEVIRGILEQEREKNAAYDGQDISDMSFALDPLQVLRHERRIRDAALFKRRDDPGFHRRVLVVGCDGSLGVPVIENLLSRGHDLVLATPHPKGLEKRLAETLALYPGATVTHIPIDLRQEETWEKEYWQNLYRETGASAVIDMAGIIEEKPETGLTFENINYKPVPAMAEACLDCGIDNFVYFSTVTAGSPEADANARQSGQPLTYAGSKRKAELALEALGDKLTWFAVRPVTTYNPKTPNWGRDFTLPDLANLPVVPVWGSGNQLMQPLYHGDLAKVARLVESRPSGNHIMNVVGPERLNLKQILRTLRRPDLDFKTVHVAYEWAQKLAYHYPIGGINRAFINVCRKLETPSAPVDHRPWAKAVGEEKGLTRLRDVYNAAAEGTVYSMPPVLKYAQQIAENPGPFLQMLEECGATEALQGSVKEVLAQLQAAGEMPPSCPPGSKLVKEIIETLGAPPPENLHPGGP